MTRELDIYLDELAKIKVTGTSQQRVLLFIYGKGSCSARDIKKGIGIANMQLQQLRSKKLLAIFYQPDRGWPRYQLTTPVKKAFARAEERCAALRAGDQPVKQP